MKKVSGKVNAIGFFPKTSIVLSLLGAVLFNGFTFDVAPLQATIYSNVALTQADISAAGVCNSSVTFIDATEQPTCYNLFCSSGGASGLGFCGIPQQMITPDHYAAIDSSSWANGALCGACAELKGPQGATTVIIVDECATCSNDEHLDLGAGAYSELMGSPGCATTLSGGSCSVGTGGGTGVNITCATAQSPITWMIIQCPLSGSTVAVNYNNSSGDISYQYKSGCGSTYDPILFDDFLFPIASVSGGTSPTGPFSTMTDDDTSQGFWGNGSNPSGTVYYVLTDGAGQAVTTKGITSCSVEQGTTPFGSTGVQFNSCVSGPTYTFTNTPTNTSNITSTFTNTPTVTPTDTPVLPPPGCPSYVYDGTAPHALGNLSEGGTNNETPSQTTGAAYTGFTNGISMAINVPPATFYALFQGNWANYGVAGATNIPSTDTFEITVNAQTAADLPMTFTISLSDWDGPGAVVGAQGVSQSAPVTEVITTAMGVGWHVFNIPMSSLSTGGTGYSLTDLGEFDWELLTTTAAETGTVYIGTVAFYGPCPPTSTFTNTPTNTATVTSTYTYTNTATSTATNTPTHTVTVTATQTATNSATNTATVTTTNSATSSPTSTATHTATNTATITPAVTNTFTNTATNTPSSTATNSPTSTATHTATNTATITPAITSTFTNTATNSPTSTVTNTATNTSAITSTFTNTATNTPTHTATNTATITPALTNTFTNTATNTPTSTATNTATITPAITNTFTNTATNTATKTATSTATNTVTNTPTVTQTQTATNTATNTITGTIPPTDTPTVTSTNTASSTATNTATSTASSSATNSSTVTSTNTASSTATETSTTTFSSTATNTATSTASETATNSATLTATNTATSTVTNTATLTVTYTMTNTPTETSTNTSTTTPTNTFTRTNTATLTPTSTTTNTATITSTYTPTRTPTSTFTQTSTATVTPTYTPTLSPDVLIYPPYPNPSTGYPITFNFQVPSESTVTMDVFTLAFRKISSQTVQAYGASTLQWDLKDISGIQVANGLYYVRFHVSGVQTTTKILKVLILR